MMLRDNNEMDDEKKSVARKIKLLYYVYSQSRLLAGVGFGAGRYELKAGFAESRTVVKNP